MFPFKNVSLFEFDVNFLVGVGGVDAAARLNLHQKITDDDPKLVSMGWSSHSVESEVITRTSSDGKAVLLRYLTETRDIDAKVAAKQVDKIIKAREAGGTLLDDDQVKEVNANVRLKLLADAVSKFGVIYVLLDVAAGMGMVSSTSKADLVNIRAALNALDDSLVADFKPELASNLPPYATHWMHRGYIGNGLTLGNQVKAAYDKCKLTLDNADLSSDMVSGMLAHFQATELAFFGHMLVNGDEIHRYVDGRIHGTTLTGLVWEMSQDDANGVDERQDYEQAELDVYCGLWRQLLGQLMINVFELSRDQAYDSFLAAAFALTCTDSPVSTDIDNVIYHDAVKHVCASRVASVSNLQRRFKIGYNSAVNIMTEMERQKIITPPGDDGLRHVLAGTFNESEAVID